MVWLSMDSCRRAVQGAGDWRDEVWDPPSPKRWRCNRRSIDLRVVSNEFCVSGKLNPAAMSECKVRLFLGLFTDLTIKTTLCNKLREGSLEHSKMLLSELFWLFVLRMSHRRERPPAFGWRQNRE
jgi:hypothetical protein